MPRPLANGHASPGISAQSREDRRTQAERSETTTDELVTAARRLFAEKGFAATSIEEIVRDAGVTRGALYHHFKRKEDVFEAVLCREQQMLSKRLRDAALKQGTAFAQLVAGCNEFLEACLDHDIQQICMIDGPAVLGPQRLLEVDNPHTTGMIAFALGNAMEEGEVRTRPVMPLAQLLFGALCQGAMAAARSEDPPAMMAEIQREVNTLLDAIRQA